ncbi:hypothetical protein INT43_006789 [Umbelopsis isabellina]|uniref:WD40 repeat-containing protein SMU1 n=1 Tax=Mortierella isabellina TaxID=91625 RepID=A0A8H7Q1S9_MORIS|nr:hypothetical protein INT43_006789 [Umbelopsis isabellina]
MSLEIESADVIRLIEQFLKENNLSRTLAALQEESSISLNTVENVDTFKQDIIDGNWDTVLTTVLNASVPAKQLGDLYEQIFLELLEMRELGAARSILRQTEPMQILKSRSPERFLRLEHLVSRTYFDAKEAYPDGTTKEKKRQAIAKALASEVSTVEPARLLTLLGQSLKWQQQQGLVQPDAAFDLFRGQTQVVKAEDDAVPSKQYSMIKFPGKKTYAECAAFSPDGQLLATGSVDGFVEIWNYLTGKLRKDLKYQAEENLIAMDNSVISLAFSKDSQLLATGSTDGIIAVWKITNGQCQRRFSPAHSQGVTSMCFNKDGSQVLSSSFDHSIKIHGLKSGKVLKEFRGHTSFVNSITFSSDMSRVISASSDGTVKIWDTKSTTCLATISPQAQANVPNGSLNPIGGASGQTVNSVTIMPNNSDNILVCSKTSTLYLINMRGQILKSFTHEKKGGADFVSASVSPHGDFAYAVAEDSTLYAFNTSNEALINEFKLTEAEVIGIAAHPYSNILAAYAENGQVLLCKA